MIENSGRIDTDTERLLEFVVDILHYDIENVQTLVSHLNDREAIGWRDLWPTDFTAREVITALNLLIAKGFVQVLVIDDASSKLRPQSSQTLVSDMDIDTLWFVLTESGRAAWQNWIPPMSE